MISLEHAQLRLMTPADLIAVIQIQAEAYVDEMLESQEVIAARLANVADTSWVVECAGQVCAYLVAYLSQANSVTPWGSEFAHKPDADTFYLHDLAVSHRAKGLRMGPWLIAGVFDQMRERGLRRAALVSVQDSQGFWSKLGFRVVDQLAPEQVRHLQTYTGPAVYMQCDL
ncbi:GNAT family N-acetyltransferase [Cellvibrio japonicus]|uniref:Putative acetyltransferase, GNAT family n=1 Tax=Cellvibrio japonicus (strain Ueda107) TaxID=498211 RepID=B3PJ75_CELJU|nr:GNAT family N-acetyltransferase [Cellvibrio japonicus]ACE84453.1 putative acetyltransferase, GNAT family [Cellvibrio japonicus Ueda107]